MARVAIVKPEKVTDPDIQAIFDWVTGAEGSVPNHFYVELNFPEYMKAKLGSTRILWEQGELSLEEIQHIGVLVSRANGCPYCTGAFCTIMNYALDKPESYIEELLSKGTDAASSERLRIILEFALKINEDAKATSDTDIEQLKQLGLTDKGIVQLVHVVSDFASYNRLNLALQTDYDYQNIWSDMAFNKK